MNAMLCPACKQPVKWISNIPTGFTCYCPSGPCPDDQMNQGAFADTKERAFAKLEQIYETENMTHNQQ